MTPPAELLYVADPMCSWCWGFTDALAGLLELMPPELEVRYVMGGLAPDSEEPMAPDMVAYVRSAWDTVERATGASFNRELWDRCTPRRSTWPACRAVICAERQRPGARPGMYAAIQRAFYTGARDPSDRATLIDLARAQGFDAELFDGQLDDETTRELLQADFRLRDELGATGFPSLAVRDAAGARLVTRGWTPLVDIVRALDAAGLVP